MAAKMDAKFKQNGMWSATDEAIAGTAATSAKQPSDQQAEKAIYSTKNCPSDHLNDSTQRRCGNSATAASRIGSSCWSPFASRAAFCVAKGNCNSALQFICSEFNVKAVYLPGGMRLGVCAALYLKINLAWCVNAQNICIQMYTSNIFLYFLCVAHNKRATLCLQCCDGLHFEW